jgi:hypothetical protein
MKKVIASISFLCYFALTTGIIVNSHYCMNRLASVHLFETSADKCGICGMKTHESNGCCKDEIIVVKLVQDQNKIPVTSFEFQAPSSLPVLLSDYMAASTYNVDEQRHFHNHSPPLLSAQDTYLQINVFRI